MLDDPRRQPLDTPQRRPSGILQIGAESGLGSLPEGTRAILLLVIEPAVVGAGVNEAGGGEDGEESGEGKLHSMNG